MHGQRHWQLSLPIAFRRMKVLHSWVDVCRSRIVPDHPARVVWNEDQTICVALAGELFGYGELRKQLIEQGHHFKFEHGFCADAEFVLHLYEDGR